MLVVSQLVFVAYIKLIYGYNFVAPLNVTSEKKLRTRIFDFVSLESSSPGQFLGIVY